MDLPRIGRPPRIDVALGAGLFGYALVEAVALEGPGGLASRVAFAAVSTLPLVLRRRWPRAVLAVSAGALVLRATGDGIPEQGATPMPSLLVATFSLALYARPRAAAWAGIPLPAAAMIAAQDYYSGSPQPGDYGILLFLMAAAWTAGWIVRLRAEAAERDAAAAATDAVRQAEERAAEAVADERARIARELHDVVAHSLSIVTMQAGAALSVLPGDPDRAAHHLERVRTTSQAALVEMRRLLDVTAGVPDGLRPVPDLEHLGALLEENREAGLPVTLEVRGEPRPVSAGAGLTVYRVVQEALTNVRKHAGPVPTSVLLSYGEGLVVEVSNETGAASAGPAGDGRGLLGMGERLRLHGGTLTVDPGTERFTLRAELSRD